MIFDVVWKCFFFAAHSIKTGWFGPIRIFSYWLRTWQAALFCDGIKPFFFIFFFKCAGPVMIQKDCGSPRTFWMRLFQSLKQKQPIRPVTRASPACAEPLYICHGRYVQLLCVLRAKLQSGAYRCGGHKANRGPFWRWLRGRAKTRKYLIVVVRWYLDDGIIPGHLIKTLCLLLAAVFFFSRTESSGSSGASKHKTN